MYSLYCSLECFFFGLAVNMDTFECRAVCIELLAIWFHEDRK